MKKLNVFLGIMAGLIIVPCAFAAQGVAMIQGTAEGSTLEGKVTFNELPGSGISIHAEISGVNPMGKRGFHIHEFGSCADAGKAAGGHYNPQEVEHGLLEHDGFDHAHAGDLGNIEIGEDGTGSLDVFIPGLALSAGERTIGGRAVVLHEKEDDFGQPTGNAGGRIGCGTIVITGNE